MTSRTASHATDHRANHKTAAIRKAERRRAAERRAARKRALQITGAIVVVAALGYLATRSSSGEKAPPVSLAGIRAVSNTEFPASDGKSVTLSQFAGSPLVLYFYEGQSCGACQTQLADIQKEFPQLQATGAHVLGVTTDPVDVSASVASQLGLSYPIVEDVDHQLGSAMGTFEASGHMGPADQHSVVVLGADGSVAWRQLAGTTMYVAPDAILSAVKGA